jgi:hypothetical protein
MKKKIADKPRVAARKAPVVGSTEVDISKFKLKRNRYAKRIAAEGILVVHDGPSTASLREMPEYEFGAVKVRRSPYARRIEKGGIELQVSRGRPPRGEELGSTVVKSVRLPPAVWERLEELARAQGVAVHALVRRAILDLLKGAA